MTEDKSDEDKYEDMVGSIIKKISTKEGTMFDCEIVRVFCPACGEKFIGSKRGAGGFIAGHQAYHEFENAQDMIVTSLGGV